MPGLQAGTSRCAYYSLSPILGRQRLLSEPRRLVDFMPGVRGGKSAYWVTFDKDEAWMVKLLEVLGRLGDG